MANPVEVWKSQKHGFDVWPDVLRYASARTPMQDIEAPDLERMKWYGAFYRKRDGAGTYMLRIRLTGCELTATQAREVSRIAYEYGYGIIDITTRANLQVQGLGIENVPRALERLEAVGLTAKQTGHDNIRNVFGHALSGVDPDEQIDVRELCREITDLFVDSREYSDLPRKLNICLNGRAEHASHYWSQDLSFLAYRTHDGEVLFQVLIGGTQGQNPRLAWHLPVLVRPDQVVDVTRAILDLFRAQGSREKRDAARLRFLIEKIGIAGVLDWLDQQLLYPLQPSTIEPPPPSGYEDLIGWFRQKEQGKWALGLCVPLGRLSWEQLEGVALAAKKWGDGTLRATIEQGLMILNIPTGFKDAAATAVAGHGISPYADTLDRNTVACTGKQFCNIAVTETKGHMLQLIEKLRQRHLTLHGIRLHMSGCPSSCAQHFTADIGLKGVRVRRLLGTREGFDVYLGGGIAGQVHYGLLYKLGVDVDQLPQLVEDVVREYYLHHKPGMTFSAYWREKLRDNEAGKVVDGEYLPPVWLCEACQYQHRGEDPPVYCPKCAGLRRNFARLDGDAPADVKEGAPASSVVRSDGYSFAARDEQLTDAAGLTVEISGCEYALFRINGGVYAIDSACPHEGAPLAQGELKDGVVTCPWHGWTFNACSGCSINPAGNGVKSYPVKIEEGSIYVNVGTTASPNPTPAGAAAPAIRPQPAVKKPVPKLPTPKLAKLKVLEVISETPDTRTFRCDNSSGALPAHRPGQFARVCLSIDGRDQWRSFTISSSPTQTGIVDLTIKLNPSGEVSRYLHDRISSGSELTLKGPQGAFLFDSEQYREPLVLISAGSGITPMLSIVRYLADTNSSLPVTFIYGARSQADIIAYAECMRLSESLPGLKYHVTLSQPAEGWTGLTGRLSLEQVREIVSEPAECRYFLCGPGDFMTALRSGLIAAGAPADRIHSEKFQSAPLASLAK